MSGGARIAAAVCHRRGADGIEFLLVRTRGGKKWTFPKGHVEAGEAPWKAAAREAREEAGAIGLPTRGALARYLYPSGSSGRDVHLVTAYLLVVRTQKKPAEPDRDPTWFSPSAALKKLSVGGREPRFVEEHQRVLDAALDRLTRKGRRVSSSARAGRSSPRPRSPRPMVSLRPPTSTVR